MSPEHVEEGAPLEKLNTEEGSGRSVRDVNKSLSNIVQLDHLMLCLTFKYGKDQDTIELDILTHRKSLKAEI